MAENDKVDPLAHEMQKMQLAVAEVTLAWADVENLMAVILRQILGHEIDGSIASAIYFAPNNLETRFAIVDRALRAIIVGNQSRAEIVEAWGGIQNTLNHLKRMRNKVAHGEIITRRSDGKSYIRFTAPLTDYASHYESRRTGQLPGHSSGDLENSAKSVRELVVRLHLMIPLVRALYSGNETTLLETLAQLRTDPQT